MSGEEPPDRKLDTYRRKRRADVTNEPFGGESPDAVGTGAKTLTGAYVVHLHDATRRHFDLRLEVAGVLASFAVPRAMSLDPAEKHLAVHTEDHPLEYLDFEDVIPDGQYGAGAMIAWDRGRALYLEGPLEDELAAGKVHLELRGLKLRGRWALVKLAKSKKGNEWLLFKKDDEHASRERDLVEEQPRSVFSGLTVEELARAAEIGEGLVARATAMGAPPLGGGPPFDPGHAPYAEGDAPSPASRRSPDAPSPASRRNAVFDVELGGVRVLASRDADAIEIRPVDPAAGGAIEAFYPELVRALRALPTTRVILDGEIVAFDDAGMPSAERLARRVRRSTTGELHAAATEAPAVLVAKDVLALGDRDLRPLPLASRRELLGALLPGVGFLRASPALQGERDAVVRSAASLGLRAVVEKPAGSAYEIDAGWMAHPTGAGPARTRVLHSAGDTSALERGRAVTVTNRHKIFWPATGDTKGDLCDYYLAVADVILPYLADRPVVLVRYPDGVAKPGFFQWNAPHAMPAWLRTIAVPHEGGEPKRVFLVDDAQALLYIANLGAIPLHILAARSPHLEHADFLTVDFDVGRASLAQAVALTVTLREILHAASLPSFAKTSGQSGLHVLVPLGEGQSFDTARGLAEVLGALLVARHPDLATTERVVGRRGARVYVDIVQTGPSRAIVSPYSVRAAETPTVSLPLDWDEVREDLDPSRFTIHTVPERLRARGRHGDPMRGLLTARPDVPRAVARLAEVFGGAAGPPVAGRSAGGNAKERPRRRGPA